MIPPWLLWAALAFLSYAAWAIFSKLVGDALSPAHSQALSTLGMLPVIAALALLKRPPDPGNRRRGIAVALVGGAVSCLGNIPFLGALGEPGGTAAAVVPVTALYPLVTVVLAMLVLRERLGPIHAVGIALSLAAIYFLNVPDDRGLLSPWLLLALVPVALWGVAGFLQKLSTFDVSSNTSAVWFLVAFVPVGVLILVYQQTLPEMTWQLWVLVNGMGFTLAFGNYAATVAYASDGKASVITPLIGLYPLAVLPVSLLYFKEPLGWRGGLGVALALVGIVALSYETPPKKVSS